MDKREATRILKEQADYWRWLAKHNGIDGYPDHRLHTIIEGLDWVHDHMANQPENAPDTQTGLMPCGCGGKARIWPSNLRQALVTDYEVGCTECAMTTGWVRGKQENAMKVWNTAMGHNPHIQTAPKPTSDKVQEGCRYCSWIDPELLEDDPEDEPFNYCRVCGRDLRR